MNQKIIYIIFSNTKDIIYTRKASLVKARQTKQSIRKFDKI